jgi:antitoxin HicB
MIKIPYIINILWSEEDDCYIADVPELEGCVTHGKTASQATLNAEDAIASWIKAAKKLKHPIPEPIVKHPVSGKFNVRLPKNIHKLLLIKSTIEGISLNQLVTLLLAKAV